jgi:hypothetical protein
MAVFCLGACFLSLEVFELPWLLVLLGAQVRALYQPEERQPVKGTALTGTAPGFTRPLSTARAS